MQRDELLIQLINLMRWFLLLSGLFSGKYANRKRQQELKLSLGFKTQP